MLSKAGLCRLNGAHILSGGRDEGCVRLSAPLPSPLLMLCSALRFTCQPCRTRCSQSSQGCAEYGSSCADERYVPRIHGLILPYDHPWAHGG